MLMISAPGSMAIRQTRTSAPQSFSKLITKTVVRNIALPALSLSGTVAGSSLRHTTAATNSDRAIRSRNEKAGYLSPAGCFFVWSFASGIGNATTRSDLERLSHQCTGRGGSPTVREGMDSMLTPSLTVGLPPHTANPVHAIDNRPRGALFPQPLGFCA